MTTWLRLLLLLAALGLATAKPVLAEAPSEPEQLEVKEGWLNAQQLLRLPNWLELGLSWTAEPFVNPIGGEHQLGNWIQQSTVSLAVGSGLSKPATQWREIDHWSINANINQYSGDPSYASAIGALFPLQQLAYPSGALLSELSVNRSAGGGWLTLKGGVVPLNPPLVTAPIFNSYVHSAFNNTLNLSLANLPINPYAALGGVVSVQPSRDLNLRYGWFDLGSTSGIGRLLGGPTLPSQPGGGSAQMLQLDWSPAALGPASAATVPGCRTAAGVIRRTANCRRPVEVQNQLPAGLFSLGGLSSSMEGQAAYASLTMRTGLPLGLDDRVWIGGSWASDAPLPLGPGFVGGGLVIQGALPSRPVDLLVFGAGRAGLSSGYEGMLELGYQWQVNRNLALQPTLQWILNPSYNPTPAPGILAAGLQISLTF